MYYRQIIDATLAEHSELAKNAYSSSESKSAKQNSAITILLTRHVFKHTCQHLSFSDHCQSHQELTTASAVSAVYCNSKKPSYCEMKTIL